jgi:hypothetical protein
MKIKILAVVVGLMSMNAANALADSRFSGIPTVMYEDIIYSPNSARPVAPDVVAAAIRTCESSLNEKDSVARLSGLVQSHRYPCSATHHAPSSSVRISGTIVYRVACP